MISSVTHLTLSFTSAFEASAKNRGIGSVVLAKGNEGTSIVIEARYINRREPKYRYGYVRFGHSKPIWVGETTYYKYNFRRIHAESGRPVDELHCLEIIDKVVDAANKVALSKQVA